MKRYIMIIVASALISLLIGSFAYAANDSVSVGDYITFGHYEQDNDSNNGEEPIEWIVISVEEQSALLISKYALDCQMYNNYAAITWEKCSLRTWLNDYFLKKAFNKEEQEKILLTTAKGDLNPNYDTLPGNDTKDYVFLLSVVEAKELFTSDFDRRCYPTQYVKAKKAYTEPKEGTCWWWTRTPGQHTYDAAFVSIDGTFYGGCCGSYVNCTDITVRPAIWIKQSQ